MGRRCSTSSLLTPREIEVLQAMADGHSTARIAVVLGISIGTVRSHVKSLLGKLGLHSRVEAVSLILRTNGRPEASLNVSQRTGRVHTRFPPPVPHFGDAPSWRGYKNGPIGRFL
jgi:DNA-binding CsgD family transcriptional regulator